jgi:hypothetical protein
MRRAFVALAIGTAIILAPIAAMAHGGASDDVSSSVGYNGMDMQPADVLPPDVNAGNAQGDGNGQ